MLPDKSLLIGQKMLENAKIEKLKCDIFSDFQTLCSSIETGAASEIQGQALYSWPSRHNH